MIDHDDVVCERFDVGEIVARDDDTAPVSCQVLEAGSEGMLTGGVER
jgi:hypothetical protein